MLEDGAETRGAVSMPARVHSVLKPSRCWTATASRSLALAHKRDPQPLLHQLYSGLPAYPIYRGRKIDSQYSTDTVARGTKTHRR